MKLFSLLCCGIIAVATLLWLQGLPSRGTLMSARRWDTYADLVLTPSRIGHRIRWHASHSH